MWLDSFLRRYGIVILVLTAPGLVLPVVAIASDGIGGMSIVSLIVMGVGFLVALALYGALAYFTIRALRR